MFGTSIQNVQIEKLNLDLECMTDILEEKGIRLQSPEAFHKKVDKFSKKTEKVYDGLQSEFFGTDFGDDAAFAERYSCKCKKYTGKMYLGKICDRCGSTVEYTDIDLTKFGWIILDKFKIISPIYDQKLLATLGKQDEDFVLDKILEVTYDEDGKVEFTDKELAQLKKHPFMHKGMVWLSNPDNLLEVLEYYERKRPKSKQKAYKELKDDLFNIFTSCIPVYTALLRTELPGEKGSKLFKLKVNTCCGAMIRISNFINGIDKEDYVEKMPTINMQLYAIQKEIREVFTDVYNSLMKKQGIIMSRVVGGRYNYSARNIIIPSSGYLRADEIVMAYSTFMELYRSELINFYSKIHNCTIIEASKAWNRGTVRFDKNFYNIMNYMVTDKKCKKYMWTLVCRNPCINQGSFQMMRVAHVTNEISNKTLTIPSNTLGPFNADFDGDVLNIFRIIGEYFSKEFCKCLNPRYNLYISRINGKINMETVPFKDEAAAFYQFNNI